MSEVVAKAGAGHGGKRSGAGRKKSGKRRGGPHRRRPSLSARHPVHVVLRVARWVPELRVGRVYRALAPVLARYLGNDDFRIVHLSIQTNHLHLLVEAADRRALTRYMQSFAINAARAINQARGVPGKVFAFRYHATQITTPRTACVGLAIGKNISGMNGITLRLSGSPTQLPIKATHRRVRSKRVLAARWEECRPCRR